MFSLICFLLGFLAAHAQAASPQPVAIAVGGDNLTRLLWNNPDGSISLWRINSDTTVAAQYPYGPYPGWATTVMAAGADSAPRVLYNHTADGQMSLWRTNPTTNAFSQFSYGPYPGWTAQAVAVGPDNAPRVLWNHTADGQITLWRVGTDGTFSQYAYGPYPGWSAVAEAVDSANAPRLLWTSGTTASLWSVAANGGLTFQNYSFPAGYTPVALACGTGGDVRLLWSDGQGDAQVWTIAASGSYTSVTYAAVPAVLASVMLNPSSVTGGNSATGTVTLSKAAPAGGATVSLTSDNTATATVPASVFIAAGAASATFTVTTTAVTATTTANIGASYSGVSQSAALTINPVPVPLYLSNLTLSSTSVTGGSSVTGTVTLSSPAPAGGITVNLLSNSGAATVPATCAVAVGSTQATFNVTTTAVSTSAIVALSGSYNGWTQGDELSVLSSSPPPAQSPGVPLIHVAPGNGCAIVSWNRSPDGTVNGYKVYRTSGGTTTLLTPTPFASNFYPDTGLTNDTATYTYQVSAVDTQGQEHALSAPVSASPSSAAATLNWITPLSAVTGQLNADVSLPTGGQIFGSLLFIDGVQAEGGGSEALYVNGAQTYTAGVGYDSTQLPNGPHTVQFLGFADPNHTVAAVTPLTSIQVSNTISSFRVDNSWFVPGQGELCYVSATAPTGSTWTVQATSADGTSVIRTWQGASSLVKLAWDGKDASGNPLPITDYAIQLTVQPPGTSSQAVTARGAKAQPKPNAATAVKKTHPVKMLQGQPIALALISVGASYYTNANSSTPIATPAQDISLANMLTNVYTTLFGASNFQIIRSDTFDPGLVVRKDAYGRNITALKQLEAWLGIAQVFYLFGHGAGPAGVPGASQIPRSTIFGAYDINSGQHLELYAAPVIFDLRDDFVVVPTYVKGNNYVFAWIDSCNSAGGDPVTGQIGTVDSVWATAFNATTFVGNNGFCIVNNNGPTAGSYWYQWRNTFWNNLAMDQNVTQAYLECWVVDGKGKGPGGTNIPYGTVDPNVYPDYYLLPPSTAQVTCTPGDGYGSNPRVVLYGQPSLTTLVPQ